MQIVIDIPDEQVKKSLEESKYIHEDEGEKGYVHISMLYTNAQLEFVDVVRKTDFYSCEYKILPKGHGRLIDADDCLAKAWQNFYEHEDKMEKKDKDYILMHRLFEQNGFEVCQQTVVNTPTIIEADKEGKNEN